MRALLHVSLAAFVSVTLSADERTQRVLRRLAEEASAFERTAPNLIAEETLRQIALKPTSPRGKQRPEEGGGLPVKGWQLRVVRSEYVFAAVGTPPEIREMRKVTAVDGRPLVSPDSAVEQLLRSIQANDERSKRKLLEDFEKHGLIGIATDFGQLLLLFSEPNQEGYAFTFAGERMLGADACHVFTYTQQEGKGALTVFDAAGKQQPKVSGEIWVTQGAYRPIRIKLNSVRQEKSAPVRDEAEVDYVPTPHGVVVPATVTHRQYRNGSLTTENRFRYSEFRRFGATALLKYSPGEEDEQP